MMSMIEINSNDICWWNVHIILSIVFPSVVVVFEIYVHILLSYHLLFELDYHDKKMIMNDVLTISPCINLFHIFF